MPSSYLAVVKQSWFALFFFQYLSEKNEIYRENDFSLTYVILRKPTETT